MKRFGFAGGKRFDEGGLDSGWGRDEGVTLQGDVFTEEPVSRSGIQDHKPMMVDF